MRKPTVSDIARHLNLSPSTVSRVLNGSQLVKDATRTRIEEAAVELGYEKRTIRRHAPRSILVVALFLPRSSHVYHRLFYDPADLLAGLTEGFGSVRVHIVVSVNRPRPELFSSKKSGNIDACVFGFTRPTDDVRALLEERGIPWVLLNRRDEQANYVATDHLAGMRLLLARVKRYRGGRLRPAYINFDPAQPVAVEREEAFRRACDQAGVALDDANVLHTDSVEEITVPLLGDVTRRCNTVFCFNDFVAVYLYQVALVAGMSIPGELSIAGYDDSPVRRLTPQKVDTVSLSPFRLGAVAGEWLRRRIIERDDASLQTLIPGDLIPGETLIP
ncbi:MAG: LacI family transcriptional regulator [Spirochaetales bacterium]|nr:LacI family transcriptional regulator [Spirochaetales bacterium]